jgi:PKD repeat protein
MPRVPRSAQRVLGTVMALVGALVVITALAISLAASVTSARVLAYPQPAVSITYGASGDSPRTGAPVRFQAQTRTGTNLTYLWLFGDGSSAAGQAPSHTFAKYGQMTVVLRVRDPIGQTSSTQTVVNILPPKPAVCFHFQQASLTVTVNASCSTGTQLRYTWSFGDGSESLVTSNPATSHRYASAGTYTVELQVTDVAGQSAATSAPVTITIPLPTARFTWQAGPFSFAGASVTFDASASTGSQLSYSWDYGDGQSDSSAGPQTAHIYTFPGVYSVTLTVTDAFGRSATSSQTVTVGA